MHPELKPGEYPNLDEYLHIIQCDPCSEKHGDAVIAYGRMLVQAALIMNASG